jgi:phosphoenolpyruvate carboxykinase (ATP)
MSDTELRSSVGPRSPPDPAESAAVVHNPDEDRLRELARADERTTAFGAPSYVSEYRSRCADLTKNAVDDTFTAADEALVTAGLDAVEEREMVCVDRLVGRDSGHAAVCRYYVPVEYARIALALTRLLEPAPAGSEPDFLTVQLPDYDETAIRVLPEEGVTVVLGSDYTGEAKKSFLRLFMFRAKQQGGLGLHAGSKRLELETADGDLSTVGQLFLGLSATGKSTLTAHDLGLEGPESASMLQDDVCALTADGRVVGSEGAGLYVKTIGLDPDEQATMYDAVTDETAVLENVDVADDGTVDFDSDRYTTNGRAVIAREKLSSADPEIDLETVDQVFFITRNPLMPPVAKLDADEAAAAFMLGESIQTSAGDPDAAGESIRVVGTNPFIVGPEGEEGTRFRDLIDDLDLDCYVLNTGHVGDDRVDVGVDESVTILREIARGTVEWTDDTDTALTIPREVPGIDIDAFHVPDHVPDYEGRIAALRAERAEYLAQFPDLDDRIVDAVY